MYNNQCWWILRMIQYYFPSNNRIDSICIFLTDDDDDDDGGRGGWCDHFSLGFWIKADWCTFVSNWLSGVGRDSWYATDEQSYIQQTVVAVVPNADLLIRKRAFSRKLYRSRRHEWQPPPPAPRSCILVCISDKWGGGAQAVPPTIRNGEYNTI